MHKGIKILGMVVSAIILLLIFLPVVATLVLNIGSVQSAMAKRASAYVSEYLGAPVSIDELEFDLFSKVNIRGFYVEDYDKDTLLYVAHAKADINGLNISKYGLRLEDAEATGVKFYLRELSTGQMNISALVEKLRNREKQESDFRLYVDDLEAKNLSFVLEKQEHRNPKYGIDFSDMQLNNIDAHITNLAVEGGAVRMDIEKLSTVEKSGFELASMAAYLSVNRGEILLNELSIDTEASSLRLPKVVLKGDDWADYRDFAHEVGLDIDISPSKLSTGDLAYFVPVLEGSDVVVKSFSGGVGGVLSDLDCRIKSAQVGASSNVTVRCSVEGLPHWGEARYVVGVERLYATAADALYVAEGITSKALPETLIDIIKRVGWVDMRATVGGVPRDFRVTGNVFSGAGDLSGDVSVSRKGDGRVGLLGEVRGVALNVGNIASVKALGSVTSKVMFNGSVGSAESGGVIGDVSLDVESVEYGGHAFTNIEGKGIVSGKEYFATVKSFDPNLKFDLKADLNLDSVTPTYDASLALHRADLRALGLNKRDALSVLSANIGIDLEGVITEGVDGNISIADIVYHYPEGKFEEDRVKIDCRNYGSYKSIHLDSDVATVNYGSSSTYSEAVSHIVNALKNYMPLLYNNGNNSAVASTAKGGSADDYTVLNITAGDEINALLDALVGGLVVAPNSSVDLRLNPAKREVKLAGESEAVQYNSWILADWECDVKSGAVRDSLEVKFESNGLYYGTRSIMQNIDISSGVCRNKVDVVASFDDEAKGGNSAMVAFTSELLRNEQTGERKFHIDLSPSYFYNASERWDLTAHGIDIEPSKVSISHFLMARPDQHLVVDGVASNSRFDAVRLMFNNFDVSGLSVFTESIGYKVEGLFNGYAVAKSAFRNLEVEASIAVDSIRINGLAVAPQQITSSWETALNRAHIVVRDRGLDKNVIDGYYSPDGNRYSADMTIANADINLLNPFLNSVLTDMEGKMNIFANITGEGQMAKFSGSALVSSFGATVGYTKARYNAPSAKITFEDNHVLASRVPLYDKDGHTGYLSLDVDLSHLRNVTYDVDLGVTDMLVLNTTASDNDSFYGRIYASGDATIRGDRRGAKMNIDVTSADDSKFYLPLQRKENLSYANFVSFVTPDIEKVDSIDFLTRLMLSHQMRSRSERMNVSTLDIDMHINVLPNIEMQLLIDPTMGDIIKAKGTGELSMHIVPEAGIFEMNGDVKISEGTYLFTLSNIINKLFTVVPGSSIHWSGDPKSADVNLDAVYSTKASLSPLIGSSVQGFDTSHAVPVDCYIKLTDKLKSPTPTFDIKVPNVAPEIQTIVQSALNDQHAIATQMFWLLAANCFSADDSGVTGASLSATTGFELLSNQLSNWLSGEDYNIILRYRPRNNISGDEVDFGFSKSWFNNRLIVELEGGYLSDASAQAMQKASNFVGEAFITWLIDPEGVMRFRGFTQTIDRYGENQGMQESGIGFYYNESFNTFAELRQSLRTRFGRGGTALKNVTQESSDVDTLRVERDNIHEVDSLDTVERDTLQIENIEINK